MMKNKNFVISIIIIGLLLQCFSFCVNATQTINIIGNINNSTAVYSIEDRLTGSQFYCYENGSMKNITVYLSNDDASNNWSGNIKCAIYNYYGDIFFIGSEIKSLLLIKNKGSDGYYTFNLTSYYNITKGSKYLLMAWSEPKTGNCKVRSNSGFSSSNLIYKSLSYGNFPSSFTPTSNSSSVCVSIYGSYIVKPDITFINNTEDTTGKYEFNDYDIVYLNYTGHDNYDRVLPPVNFYAKVMGNMTYNYIQLIWGKNPDFDYYQPDVYYCRVYAMLPFDVTNQTWSNISFPYSFNNLFNFSGYNLTKTFVTGMINDTLKTYTKSVLCYNDTGWLIPLTNGYVYYYEIKGYNSTYNKYSDWIGTATHFALPIGIVDGWDMVSIPRNISIPVEDIYVINATNNFTWNDAVANGVIINWVYGWDYVTQNYEWATTFEGYRGYWIFYYIDGYHLWYPEIYEGGTYEGIWYFNYTDENLTINISYNKETEVNNSGYLINEDNWLKIMGFSLNEGELGLFLVFLIFSLAFYIDNSSEKRNIWKPILLFMDVPISLATGIYYISSTDNSISFWIGIFMFLFSILLSFGSIYYSIHYGGNKG